MMKIVLLTALGVGGATIFGSLIGFVFRNISHKFSDIVLSFAGGTMLYVISDEMIPETHAAGRSRFNETAIIGHSIIEPEAAGEVIAVKAVSGQDTTGDVAAQTALTDDVDRLTLVQLTQPLPQLVHRDVKEAVNVSVCEFSHSAGVQQSYASVTRKNQWPGLPYPHGEAVRLSAAHPRRRPFPQTLLRYDQVPSLHRACVFHYG